MCLYACTNKAIEVWESIIVQNKSGTGYSLSKQCKQWEYFVLIHWQTGGKKSPLPCKGPCNILQCAVFTLGPCCHMFVFTSLEMTREIPAVGCRAGPASFPLQRVVMLGWVLPAWGRNRITSILLKVVKFLVGLDLTFPRVRATPGWE